MSERWKPEKGEKYWFINFDGKVLSTINCEENSDARIIKFGNMFKTKVEAEAAAEKIRKFLLEGYDLKADFDPIYKVLEYLGDKLKKSVENIPPTMPYDQYKLTQTINFLKNKKSELAVFPEWCKVGEWVYSPFGCDPTRGTYFKITKIDDICIFGENDVCHVDYAVRARLRPYNSEEMKALVGKVIEKGPSLPMVTGFENVFDNECMVHANGCLYNANNLLQRFTVNGSPCGVLEHLNENLEWEE
jgi:hypothetical protein